MFSCDICEISKNTFSMEHLWSLLLYWFSCLSKLWFNIIVTGLRKTLFKQLNRDDTLCEKCTNTEVFLVRIFPHSDWIRRFTTFITNTRKYGLEKTPYLDTFPTVSPLSLANRVTSVFALMLSFRWQLRFVVKLWFLKNVKKCLLISLTYLSQNWLPQFMWE